MTEQFHKAIGKDEVLAQFKSRCGTITRLAIMLGIAAGAVLILIHQGIASNTAAIVLIVTIFACATIVNLTLWRCPSCNGHLGRLYLGLKQPKFCPNCGIRLIEG